MAGNDWHVVGKGGKISKAKPVRSTTVAPAPKLDASPRKGSTAPALSKPVAHTPPAKPVIEVPKRVESSTATKELAPMAKHTPPGAPALASPPPKPVAKSAPALPPPKPKPAPKPKPVSEQVIERGYPLGFESEKEFRDATRPIAKLARDGTVFVSGSSVTGKSFAKGTPFGAHSDIDVGVASRRLRADDTQVQQSGPGRAFPVRGSDLDKARGRTRERHPIGAKVFNGVPYERTVLVREHTPEGLRDD